MSKRTVRFEGSADQRVVMLGAQKTKRDLESTLYMESVNTFNVILISAMLLFFSQ